MPAMSLRDITKTLIAIVLTLICFLSSKAVGLEVITDLTSRRKYRVTKPDDVHWIENLAGKLKG